MSLTATFFHSSSEKKVQNIIRADTIRSLIYVPFLLTHPRHINEKSIGRDSWTGTHIHIRSGHNKWDVVSHMWTSSAFESVHQCNYVQCFHAKLPHKDISLELENVSSCTHVICRKILLQHIVVLLVFIVIAKEHVTSLIGLYKNNGAVSCVGNYFPFI